MQKYIHLGRVFRGHNKCIGSECESVCRYDTLERFLCGRVNRHFYLRWWDFDLADEVLLPQCSGSYIYVLMCADLPDIIFE